MRLIMKENPNKQEPEVTIEYKELSANVKRVSNYVRSVDKVISCKKENEEYSVPINEIYYMESVDKKGFIYTGTDVYQTSHRLLELEKMLSGFSDDFTQRERLFVLFYTSPMSKTSGKISNLFFV